MGKEKRKTRLNKGESGEFIGFGAFAAPAPATSEGPSLTLSPVYTGSDQTLQVLFPRIGQKRDATTKAKAVQELRDYFTSEEVPKKHQVEALAHFLYLYHSKLHYDIAPRVRASCLECCLPARKRLPKAWNALCEQQPEVLGMLVCARADPATDVRMAADQLDMEKSATEGVWDYVKRILSYGKPSAMHEDLFQKSKEVNGSLSDRQKEELDERYERIVGTALGGLALFLQQHPDCTAEGDVRYLWKTIANPKPSLRRKTYTLISICCQKSPALVDRDKVSKLLSQNLSSEREASSIPALLGTLLAFVAHITPEERTTTMSLYTKPLTKLFQRGCHGATEWAPTVLPIVALLPQDAQANVLTSVWEGRSQVVGAASQLQIVAAVAETATFLLQKTPDDLSEIIAKCLLQALNTYLTTTSVKGTAQRAQRDLKMALARDLQQLDQASTNKPNSAIFQLRDWFWNEELSKVVGNSNVDNQHLAGLLKEMKEMDGKSSHLVPILKQKLLKLLEQCQGASALVPSLNIYQLWIAILERIPVNQVLEKIDKFVMNDLLRWMVIHTSSLSDQADEQLAKQDFQLLYLCRKYASDSIWDSVLKELVTAKCNLQHLVAGLVILTEGGASIQSTRSSVLDDLCIQVALEAVEPHTVHEDETDATELQHAYHNSTSDFLQTCAGLGQIDGSLVADLVVQAWIECACPQNTLQHLEFNPVLETLVFLAKNERLQESELQRVLMQSWRQGGGLWQETLGPWLLGKVDVQVVFVELACQESQSVLRQAAAEGLVDIHLAQLWSERASRLLRMCHGESTDLPSPSLSVVGLADVGLWKQIAPKESESFAALCLMKLVGQIDDVKERWTLFANSEVDTLELFVNILISLSGADTDILKANKARRRQDTCFSLIMELGGKSLEYSLLQSWTKQCISTLFLYLRDGAPEANICRGIAVLSQLIELRFSPLRPSLDLGAKDMGELDKVREGDSIWYITNAENPSIRETCTVIKVHKHLPSETYFSIKVLRKGVAQERQTLGERLRTGPAQPNEGSNDINVAVDKIDIEEFTKRQESMEVLLDDLITPHWDSWKSYEFELLNIAISQLGLLGERGIGSKLYTVFQRLVSIQGSLALQFSDVGQNKDSIVSMLWTLSLALGYGCNTPSSQWSFSLISFDATAAFAALETYYDNADREPDTLIDRAVAIWLSVSASCLDDKEKREKAYSLLFRLAANLFVSGRASNTFSSNDFIALRSIQAAQKGSHDVAVGESIVQDSEAEALVELVKAFSSAWEDVITTPSTDDDEPSVFADPLWHSSSVVASVMELSLKRRAPLIAAATRQCADNLVKALFVDSKRWHAMCCLGAYADEGMPLHEDPDNSMNDETALKLKAWCTDLLEDEAGELQADAEIVSQWVPRQLMNELESWHDAPVEPLDERRACGRMSCWLAFLLIVDVAASKDTMNRPALTSYITKCKAVDAILDMAMTFGNIGSERKVKLDKVMDVDDVLGQESSVQVSKLAALALFRTVEVFPTLSKNWWEMGCPKYFTQAVRDFVEIHISPEILRRELDRIKAASSFGAMNVKGSTVSREITATYLQDDFTLTVVITMPLSFPFRRAEVDCSKTLGVPESRWKRWSLQITQMLNNQGGSLKDALLLWKENVDKEFEGVEPCPVCYSVLHVKTHKLPSMECKTCHNQFHFDCLTQWFRSSGKSACVICQQPWSGTRV